VIAVIVVVAGGHTGSRAPARPPSTPRAHRITVCCVTKPACPRRACPRWGSLVTVTRPNTVASARSRARLDPAARQPVRARSPVVVAADMDRRSKWSCSICRITSRRRPQCAPRADPAQTPSGSLRGHGHGRPASRSSIPRALGRGGRRRPDQGFACNKQARQCTAIHYASTTLALPASHSGPR
jgi:hypothetical protein